LDPVLWNIGIHPDCFEQVDEGDPFAAMLKLRLIEMIRWADGENPRAKQVDLGPSEIGDPCDRRIAYRLTGVEGCNKDFDPWASIVGTAVHTWLESAITFWMQAHGSEEWITEKTLLISDFIQGHSDLYWKQHQTVIDWKTIGPDGMKKLQRDGAPEGYQIQTHIYGYGYEQAGWPVKKVSLVFLPRAGWLKNMFVWTADYDRSIAEAALDRISEIAQQILELDILTDGNSYRFEQIFAVPSNTCGWCPWYDPSRDAERGADSTGCPGR
jgi:hypothetical protein